MDLTILLEGHGFFNIDGVELDVGPGTAVLGYSEKLFTIRLIKGSPSRLCWCNTGELSIDNSERQSIRELPYSLSATPLMHTLMREGLNIGGGDSSNRFRLRNSLGESIFNEYFYQAGINLEDSCIPRPIARAKRYIEKNFNKPIGLKELAGVVGLNPRYLLRLFKKHVELTPTRYLWKIRAEHGIDLLHNSRLNIGQIADRCGFKSSNHFSRYIKTRFGNAPSKLRANSHKRFTAYATGQAKEIKY